MNKVHVDAKHLNIILGILQRYPYKFYAFGSRVKGTHRNLSDLDLCYKENIPGNIIAHIDEDFEESNLPFKVDISCWNTMSDNFKQIIHDDLLELCNYNT